MSGLRTQSFRQRKNARSNYYQSTGGVTVAALNCFYKDMLKTKHIKVHKDEEYLPLMDHLINEHFDAKSTNNTFKYCKSCYAFVTRKMQAKHQHDQLLDFSVWCDFYWKSHDLNFLKDEAEKKNLKKKYFWYAPGFTRDSCCGDLSKIRKKPKRDYKTEKVNQYSKSVSKLQKRELCLSVFQETFWPEKKIKLDTLKSLSRCPNCNAKNKRAQKDSAEVSTDGEENFDKPVYTQAHFHN